MRDFETDPPARAPSSVSALRPAFPEVPAAVGPGPPFFALDEVSDVRDSSFDDADASGPAASVSAAGGGDVAAGEPPPAPRVDDSADPVVRADPSASSRTVAGGFEGTSVGTGFRVADASPATGAFDASDAGRNRSAASATSPSGRIDTVVPPPDDWDRRSCAVRAAAPPALSLAPLSSAVPDRCPAPAVSTGPADAGRVGDFCCAATGRDAAGRCWAAASCRTGSDRSGFCWVGVWRAGLCCAGRCGICAGVGPPRPAAGPGVPARDDSDDRPLRSAGPAVVPAAEDERGAEPRWSDDAEPAPCPVPGCCPEPGPCATGGFCATRGSGEDAPDGMAGFCGRAPDGPAGFDCPPDGTAGFCDPPEGLTGRDDGFCDAPDGPVCFCGTADGPTCFCGPPDGPAGLDDPPDGLTGFCDAPDGAPGFCGTPDGPAGFCGTADRAACFCDTAGEPERCAAPEPAGARSTRAAASDAWAGADAPDGAAPAPPCCGPGPDGARFTLVAASDAERGADPLFAGVDPPDGTRFDLVGSDADPPFAGAGPPDGAAPGPDRCADPGPDGARFELADPPGRCTPAPARVRSVPASDASAPACCAGPDGTRFARVAASDPASDVAPAVDLPFAGADPPDTPCGLPAIAAPAAAPDPAGGAGIGGAAAILGDEAVAAGRFSGEPERRSSSSPRIRVRSRMTASRRRRRSSSSRRAASAAVLARPRISSASFSACSRMLFIRSDMPSIGSTWGCGVAAGCGVAYRAPCAASRSARIRARTRWSRLMCSSTWRRE